jgi:hypothetical protein
MEDGVASINVRANAPERPATFPEARTIMGKRFGVADDEEDLNAMTQDELNRQISRV